MFFHIAPLQIPSIVGWPQGVRAKASDRVLQRPIIFAWRDAIVDGQVQALYIPPQDASFTRGGLFVENGPYASLLNRSQMREPFLVRAVPLGSVKNWLHLEQSQKMHQAAAARRGSSIVDLGVPEPDPFDRDGYVGKLGQSILLEIVNGSPTVRFRLAVTASLNPRPYNDLPVITIVGKNRISVRDLGFGSARIVTGPIQPFEAFGRRYVTVHFGERLVKFEHKKSWVMSLYGKSVDLEPRRFALYGRDISIDGVDFPAPTIVQSFPRDFLNQGFLYSGAFEDGWLGPIFSGRLRSPSAGYVLHIRINVPPGAPKQRIGVTIDGRRVGEFAAEPGAYADFTAPPGGSGLHTVVMRAQSVADILPGDGRRTWGQLMMMGFTLKK